MFPDIGVTKGGVVSYYERIAPRALPHVAERPLSIKRFPQGLGGPGFFQKNVPPHYPPSIARLPLPRSREATRTHASKRNKGKAGVEPAQDHTVYPVVSQPEHLAFLANQGAIELHVPLSRAADLDHPDRVVIDLDPPEGATALVRRAALLVRAALERYGLGTVPVATGSKGYHLVGAIQATVDAESLSTTFQKLATLLAARHSGELTTAFRIADRGGRVFVDWLRNRRTATVIAPYSLRAKARASVATPLTWAEVESVAPDAFAIGDLERLLDRPDPLAELAARPSDARPFVLAVQSAFESSGLVLETFDRFRG